SRRSSGDRLARRRRAASGQHGLRRDGCADYHLADMDAAIDFDAVLAAPPPDFDEAAIIAIAERTFGLVVGAARDLGSERDQTFLLLGDAATPRGAVQVLNAAEDPATLDMEALAVHHAARVDPGLPLAL